MNLKTFEGAPLQGVKETQKLTGLSRAMLYDGAKSGRFPHVRAGTRILFHVPKLLDVLEEMSTGGGDVD